MTPPSDFDGGPMLAYNFLFFYPLAFLSIILSIIVVFRWRHFSKTIFPKVFLFISILPSIILTVMVIVNFLRIANEPEILDLEIYNTTVSVKVNDSLEVKLHGLTKRIMAENDSIIEQRIVNLIPYVDGEYRYKDGGEFTGFSEKSDLYFITNNDSLNIYSVENDFQYFNVKRTELPIKIKSIIAHKLSIEKLEREGFKKMEW